MVQAERPLAMATPADTKLANVHYKSLIGQQLRTPQRRVPESAFDDIGHLFRETIEE